MLKLTEMSVAYGGMVAVKGISIHVNQGEIVSIIGSNGAGKTSTVKGISGLVPYRCEEVLFNGERIDRLKPHTIVQLGAVQVPEGRGIFCMAYREGQFDLRGV